MKQAENNYPFTTNGYIRFLNNLKALNRPIVTLEDSFDRSGVINIRHDIDDKPEISLLMARIENKMHIQSTYFVLNTAEYYYRPETVDIIKEIATLGHKIGWHNNALAEHMMTGWSFERCVKDPLAKLRMHVEITGTASHGDYLCHENGFLNYYIFTVAEKHSEFPNFLMHLFTLEELGLTYEAYHTGHTHYISDSGGRWNHDTAAVLGDFDKNGGKLQVLVHPQWWAL